MAAHGHAERCKQHGGVHPDIVERSVHDKEVGVMGACSARVEVKQLRFGMCGAFAHGTRYHSVWLLGLFHSPSRFAVYSMGSSIAYLNNTLCTLGLEDGQSSLQSGSPSITTSGYPSTISKQLRKQLQ